LGVFNSEQTETIHFPFNPHPRTLKPTRDLGPLRPGFRFYGAIPL
jgi:hypothetical protein